MKILALKETKKGENRIAITPDIALKYQKQGYDVFVETKAGENCNISDKDFEQIGVKIIKDRSGLDKFDVIIFVNTPDLEKSRLKKDVILIGLIDPFNQKDKIVEFSKEQITAFAMEFVPRITRAQTMDVLSSQSNLAGYRSVIDAIYELNIATPMMMTAAGTISPAKALILGAGVAGLQAIATAKRMGCVVSAFDVRAAAKEQVESLGGKFIEVQDSQNDGEDKGGYAKEMNDEYKKKQEKTIFDNIIKQDIVISTALIPGRPAPLLITDEMVNNMKPGSVIVDMATIAGGNCSASQAGEIVIKNGVKIIGYDNIASRVAVDASKLYARNLYNFIELITDSKDHIIKIDLEDEILKSSVLCHQGQIINERIK